MGREGGSLRWPCGLTCQNIEQSLVIFLRLFLIVWDVKEEKQIPVGVCCQYGGSCVNLVKWEIPKVGGEYTFLHV